MIRQEIDEIKSETEHLVKHLENVVEKIEGSHTIADIIDECINFLMNLIVAEGGLTDDHIRIMNIIFYDGIPNDYFYYCRKFKKIELPKQFPNLLEACRLLDSEHNTKLCNRYLYHIIKIFTMISDLTNVGRQKDDDYCVKTERVREQLFTCKPGSVNWDSCSIVPIEDRIVLLRREKDLTQEQLANHLDVSRQLVASWESGRTKPNLNHIIELTKIFDCSTDYLFGLKKTRKPESCLPESDEYVVEFLLTIRYDLTPVGSPISGRVVR